MTMFFAKKLNKKGFTLAELLIVVAIIAVLVAIAIPIFMNSLAKAEKAAENANVRNVKSAAINMILSEWDTAPNYMGYTDHSAGTIAKAWDVKAVIENGDIVSCEVKPVATAGHTTPQVTKTDEDDYYKYEIELSITDVDVSKSS